jgi:hypothetical protein
MLENVLGGFRGLGERLVDKRWRSGVVTRDESVQTCGIELVWRIFCSQADDREIEVPEPVACRILRIS